MKTAGVSAEDIVDGYVTYWASQENPKGLTDIDVAYEDDVLNVTLKSTSAAISDSDLFDVAEAAGVDFDEAVFSWTNHVTGYESGNQTKADLVNSTKWPAIVANILKGQDYTITVEYEGAKITVELTADLAETEAP